MVREAVGPGGSRCGDGKQGGGGFPKQILIFWRTSKCIVVVQFGAQITVWF